MTPTDINLQSDPFIYVVPIIALAGIFIGKYLYRQQLGPFKTKDILREKLNGFQTASIIQYALVEGPALLGIAVFGISGNPLYLVIAATLILYLFMLRPTKNKVERDLELKGEHKRQLSRMDEPLG